MKFLNLSITENQFMGQMKKFEPSLKLFPQFYITKFFESMEAVEDIPFHVPYICPLCLQNGFMVLPPNEYMLSSAKAAFDIDHYPPESAGGKDFLIVCKACNNSAGTEYDHTLKKKAEFLAFSKGNIGAFMNTDAQITGVLGKYASQMSIDLDGKLQISLKKKGKKLPPLDSWLANQQKGLDWKMTLSYQEPKPDKVRKALLKSAYLYCFAHWGYDFVLSYTGEMMRNVLNGDLEYPYEDVAPFWIDDIPNIPKGVCVMQIDDWESFCVNIPLKAKAVNYETIVTVLIPMHSKKGWKKLEEFKAIYSSSEQFNVSFTALTDGI